MLLRSIALRLYRRSPSGRAIGPPANGRGRMFSGFLGHVGKPGSVYLYRNRGFRNL